MDAMKPPTPGLVESLLLYAGIAAAWVCGESGRVLIASGAGGLARWIGSERKRIRDGVVAVIGGAISGTYLWPMVLWALRMEHTPDSIAMAAFVAGTIGMSLTKVAGALVETKIRGAEK